MSTMNIKAILKEMRESLLHVQLLTEQAEKYREMAIKSSGKFNGGSPEMYVLNLMDVHAELQDKVNQLIQKNREAEKLILTLEDPRHRAVMTAYYLCGYGWQEVADKTNYTLRWVHKLHRAAIGELERRYAK